MQRIKKLQVTPTLQRLFLLLAMVITLSLSAITLVHARPVFSTADPAFAGSVTIPLPPPPPPVLGAGDTVFQFQSNGVTFDFQSTSGQALNGTTLCGGIVSWGFFAPGEGVVVTINPPVSAVGFVGVESDGKPGGTFVGTLANEVVNTANSPQFFGAADIGDISSVNLSAPASVFCVTEITFVPPVIIPGDSDLDVLKDVSSTTAVNSQALSYAIDVENLGPDTAEEVIVIDFLDPVLTFDNASIGGVYDPAANAVTWLPGDFPVSANSLFTIDGTTPADKQDFYCKAPILNVAVANSLTVDLDLSNNLSIATTDFDPAAIPPTEICGNGIDDDCDGFFECADSDCFCPPTLPTALGGGGNPACFGGLLQGPNGQPIFVPGFCPPEQNNADDHQCRLPRGRCGGKVLPAFCCDPGRLSDPSLDNLMQLRSACDLSSECVPIDPNFKESDPPVNTAGYGYTAAGLTMTYIIHYENIGNADALNVSIIDVLDAGLDETTLVINDAGVYNPVDRSIVWTDMILPPATPRTVSFEVAVRTDATPGQRVRNTATIVFPNAVPPSRIDTNFVEHVVPDPDLPITSDLSVIGCAETSPGSGAWRVDLLNAGVGFAYNVTAKIIDPPPSVSVQDSMVSFAHIDDFDPSILATVIPNATTMSTQAALFSTDTPGDPCAALTWRIEWENLREDVFSKDVQAKPDRDDDGVPDNEDNCPDDFNPDQTDSNNNGTGDVCELIGDSDGDGVNDEFDVCPNSDLSQTVRIEDCDSGVGNHLGQDGCTFSDLIVECAETATVHGEFVSCVAHLTNKEKKAGNISGKEKGIIERCAAQAGIPSDMP